MGIVIGVQFLFIKSLIYKAFSILSNDIRLRGVPETVVAEPFSFVDDIAFQPVQTDDLLIAAAVAEILLGDRPEGVAMRHGMDAVILGGFRACHGERRGLDRRHDGVLTELVLVDDRAVAADLYHIPAELLHPAGNGFAVIVGAARDGHEVTDLDRPGGLGGFNRLHLTAERCRDLGCRAVISENPQRIFGFFAIRS